MKNMRADQLNRSEASGLSGMAYSSLGKIVGSTPERQIVVEVKGKGKKVARLLAGVDREDLSRGGKYGREVLLIFPDGDFDRPIIVGLMEDSILDMVSIDAEGTGNDVESQKEFRIDGKKVLIEAEEEVLIKCGKGGIILRKDGKIVLIGTNVLSRSSGSNRIKGASVNIN